MAHTNTRTYLTIAQSAALLSCSIRTLERRIAAGQYAVEYDDKGRRLLDMTEAAARLQTDAQALQAAGAEARHEAAQLAQVLANLTDWHRTESGRLHDEIERLRRQSVRMSYVTAASVAALLAGAAVLITTRPDHVAVDQAVRRQTDTVAGSTATARLVGTDLPLLSSANGMQAVSASAPPTDTTYDTPACFAIDEPVPVVGLESTASR